MTKGRKHTNIAVEKLSKNLNEEIQIANNKSMVPVSKK